MVLVLFFLFFFDFLEKIFFSFSTFSKQNKWRKKCTFLRIFTMCCACCKNSQERTFFLRFCFESKKNKKYFPKTSKKNKKNKHKNHQNLCSRSTNKKNDNKKCCSYHLACFLASFWFFRGKEQKILVFSKKN